MSSEPGRTKAYSSDLRWRIVWHCVALNHKYRETTQALCISIETVSNVMKIFSASGDITGKKSPGRPSLHALTAYEELFVISMVLENPRVEQHEICEAVLETTGTEVSISTICRVLRKYDMTRKKKYSLLLYKEVCT